MKEKSRVTIICAIITAVAGIIAGGSQIELKNAQTASQEINVNIIQTLDETGNSNLSLSTDLSSSTDELITAYKKAVNDWLINKYCNYAYLDAILYLSSSI